MEANVVEAGRESGDRATGKVGPVVYFRASTAAGRLTFVQAFAPERFIPFEATAAGPAIGKATGLLPLFSGRPEP